MEFKFRLYISGMTPRNHEIIRGFRDLCRDFLPEPYQLQVIDLLDEPQMAQLDTIQATPTLVKAAPGPQRRIIGDLSNRQDVFQVLGIGNLEDPLPSSRS